MSYKLGDSYIAGMYQICCPFSMNRLRSLPRGFGAFPVLEVLDLTYNNLDEKALPNNFFMMGKAALRLLTLYLYPETKLKNSTCCLFELICVRS